MNRTVNPVLITALALSCATASALEFDGKLPLYPAGHNLSDIPASAVARGVPLVLETADAIHQVDQWYSANAKSCTRSAQDKGVKYQCPTGSIMIYEHGGKTQVALVPSMLRF
jgi:hypothetical protein